MARNSQSILDFMKLESSYINEFRRLVQKLNGKEDGEELKTILVTSAMLSEGKSTNASFLAMVAARQNGLKTLLIDADLRRPSIHKLFCCDRAPGLSDVLVEGYNFKDATRSTEIPKLDIVTSGTYHEHPSDIFDAQAIGVLLDELKFFYDLIIIDSPPLMPVSDPMLLASKVDGILLVVKAGKTDREVVQTAVNMLGSSRENLLGVIMNNAENSLPYYYDSRYYGYDYKPTGGSKSGSRSKGPRRGGLRKNTKHNLTK